MDAEKIKPLYIPVWGLFIISLLSILYFAKAIFIPVFLAILTAFLLNPIVALLREKLRIPRPIGAGIVLIFLLFANATVGNYLADPAGMWFERLPAELKQAELKLKVLKKSFKNVHETTENLGLIAGAGSTSSTPELVVRGPNLFYRVLDSTQSFLVGFLSYVILLYLLMAFSRSFARDVSSFFMNRKYSKTLITISKEAQTRISNYLLLITVINVVLGCVVTFASWATNMPNPMVWGASAALLNYIPYIGPAINLLIVSLVALLTFDSISQVLLPPLLLLGINIIEGQLVQPMTVGRVFTINPLVVFLSIIVWGWLWGAAGVFMAVPILMVVTVIIEQSRKLRGDRSQTELDDRGSDCQKDNPQLKESSDIATSENY